MTISFTCPHCGHHTEVAARYAGQSGPCIACGKPVTVPPLAAAFSATRREKPSKVLIILMLLGGLFVCGTIAAFVFLPVMLDFTPTAKRPLCVNHLKQLTLAMHNYHDTYKTFPPAYVANENGQPMHSWRMLLLPFLAGEDVAARYRWDEPWDSPTNREVTAVCPQVFRCPSDVTNGGKETNYVMIVGPGMLSDGTSCSSLRQIPDGTSNTIMIVEVTGSGIDWAEPRDLEADKISFRINDPQTLGISSQHPGGVNCALCDGSVQFLSNNASPMLVKDACTIAGGETVDPTKLQQ